MNKSLKKSSLALLAGLVIVAAACGGGGDEEAAPDSTVAGEQDAPPQLPIQPVRQKTLRKSQGKPVYLK